MHAELIIPKAHATRIMVRFLTSFQRVRDLLAANPQTNMGIIWAILVTISATVTLIVALILLMTSRKNKNIDDATI